MTAGVDEATLERLRAEGDQPAPLFQLERVCGRPGCNQLLVRRVGEKSNRFRDRECCSTPCANSLRQSRRAAQKPICAREGCGERTKQPRRAHCSITCSNMARRNEGGDARREGQQREAARKAEAARTGRVAARKPLTAPDEVSGPVVVREPAPVWRPASWSKQAAS